QHRAGTVLLASHHQLAFENVPDLGKVMFMKRVMGSRFIADQPRVGLGGPLGVWVEQHLPGLAGPPDGLPLDAVDVSRLARNMRYRLHLTHALLLSCLLVTGPSGFLRTRPARRSR